MELKADSLHLQLLKLAKEGNGLIAPSAFISFSCRPVEPLSPVAFTSEESHVVTIFDIVYKKSGFSLSQKHLNLKYNLVPNSLGLTCFLNRPRLHLHSKNILIPQKTLFLDELKPYYLFYIGSFC